MSRLMEFSLSFLISSDNSLSFLLPNIERKFKLIRRNALNLLSSAQCILKAKSRSLN